VANDAGYRSATGGAAARPTRRTATHSSTFPAGTALFALGVSFVLLRVTVRYTHERLGAARVAVATGITGALLAAGALIVALLEGARGRGERAWAVASTRVIVAAPMVIYVVWALFDDAPEQLKWLALCSAGLTVVSSLVHGIVRARGLWLACGALALLLVGELIELAWPPAHFAAPMESRWPALLDGLGKVSEIAALLGAPLALAWSVAATRRIGGNARVGMFAPFPLLLAGLLTLQAISLRRTTVLLLAKSMFGVRFDVFGSPGDPLGVSRGELLLYLLVPQLLICASVISIGGVLSDRGGAARRALGWVAVLLAGFGINSHAGPMDPVRLVTVALGAVLLERAAVLEAEDRHAPA
jgi:hypothetical protein